VHGSRFGGTSRCAGGERDVGVLVGPGGRHRTLTPNPSPARGRGEHLTETTCPEKSTLPQPHTAPISHHSPSSTPLARGRERGLGGEGASRRRHTLTKLSAHEPPGGRGDTVSATRTPTAQAALRHPARPSDRRGGPSLCGSQLCTRVRIPIRYSPSPPRGPVQPGGAGGGGAPEVGRAPRRVLW